MHPAHRFLLLVLLVLLLPPQGGGVGALLALRLNTEEKFKQDLGAVKVNCVGVASAACLTG